MTVFKVAAKTKTLHISENPNKALTTSAGSWKTATKVLKTILRTPSFVSSLFEVIENKCVRHLPVVWGLGCGDSLSYLLQTLQKDEVFHICRYRISRVSWMPYQTSSWLDSLVYDCIGVSFSLEVQTFSATLVSPCTSELHILFSINIPTPLE